MNDIYYIYRNSSVTEFFTGGIDHAGRTIEEFINYDDVELEACHDVVQSMFPLHEKSFHSRFSLIVTPEDAEAFKVNPVAINNLKRAYIRFAKFLGVEPDDLKKQNNWCHDNNHNLLRVTRIIRCLRIFGLESEAREFYNNVMRISNNFHLSFISQDFWTDAMEKPVFDPMQIKFTNMISGSSVTGIVS